MKKVIIVFLALNILLGLVVMLGCGGHKSGPPATGSMAAGGAGPVAGHGAAKAPAATVLVAGRLTDRHSGLPLAQVVVLVQNASNSRLKLLGKAVTDGNGSYSFANLPLGVPLRLVSQPLLGVISYDSQASEVITLIQGMPAQVVNLTFEPLHLPGRLEGGPWQGPAGQVRPSHVQVVQLKGAGQGQVSKQILRVVTLGEDGSFQAEGLPAGNYELQYGRPAQAGPGQPCFAQPLGRSHPARPGSGAMGGHRRHPEQHHHLKQGLAQSVTPAESASLQVMASVNAGESTHVQAPRP